jgi:putative addiction module antidote
MVATEKQDIKPTVLHIKKIGNSVGLILPKELLSRLRLEEGDALFITEEPDRGFTATPYDAQHADAMSIGRKMFRRYANTFRELAK